MAARVRWDLYEAIVLLDAYVKYADGSLTKDQAIERVSALLRKRAFLAGETIDESYRNKAGISYQMSVMQYVMTDGEKGVAQSSSLFRDAAQLYRADPDKYVTLLRKALALSNDPEASISDKPNSGFSSMDVKQQSIDFNDDDNANDPLIRAIRNQHIEYIDNRMKGGCLWLVGGNELNGFVREMHEQGINFYYKRSAKAVGGRGAWWTRCQTSEDLWSVVKVPADGVSSAGRNTRGLSKSDERLAEIIDQHSNAASFRQWMMSNGLAESTARSYSSAINNAEQFARSRGYNNIAFYGCKGAQSARQMADALFRDQDFIRYNNRQHNRFRAAFRQFIEYAGRIPASNCYLTEATPPRLDSCLPSNVEKLVLDIVASGFPNGVRLDSVIDRKKIGRLYRERTGEEPPNDNSIRACLSSNGILYNGKLYLIDQATRDSVKEVLADEGKAGHRLFYYQELYDGSAERFMDEMIHSADALKWVIEASCPELIVRKNHCAIARNVTIEDEILRVFGDDVSLTVDELKQRLPFIPLSKITPSLSLSQHFVRVRVGEYARVDVIEIDASDASSAITLVEDEISRYGFASLSSIDITRTTSNNLMLSEAAIREAFYLKILLPIYSKKGQIITREGESASATEVMRAHCRNMETATLDELDELERSITGQVRNTILPIACATMVRVSRDLFVSDERVSFDVRAVDKALAFFVGDGIAPIKAVTSFNSFPYVGQPWTLYLLESFVARFSQEYRISGGPARTDNVGAIYPGERGYANHSDVIARVLADSALDLDSSEASDYLVRVGFVLRKTSLVRGAIEKARTLRDIEGL